jgi:hypothetical protein
MVPKVGHILSMDTVAIVQKEMLGWEAEREVIDHRYYTKSYGGNSDVG